MRISNENKLLVSALISLCILFLFAFYLVPKYGANQFSDNITLLDVRLWYSASDVTELFTNLGESGRETYTSFVLFIDMVYPLVYGITLIFFLAFLLKKKVTKSSYFLYLTYLPFGIMFFDYLENTNTLILLNKFPAVNSSLVLLGSMATFLKWLLVLLSIGTFVLVSISLLYRTFVMKPNKHHE